jgi:hypothetical protein
MSALPILDRASIEDGGRTGSAGDGVPAIAINQYNRPDAFYPKAGMPDL